MSPAAAAPGYTRGWRAWRAALPAAAVDARSTPATASRQAARPDPKRGSCVQAGPDSAADRSGGLTVITALVPGNDFAAADDLHAMHIALHQHLAVSELRGHGVVVGA